MLIFAGEVSSYLNQSLNCPPKWCKILRNMLLKEGNQRKMQKVEYAIVVPPSNRCKIFKSKGGQFSDWLRYCAKCPYFEMTSKRTHWGDEWKIIRNVANVRQLFAQKKMRRFWFPADTVVQLKNSCFYHRPVRSWVCWKQLLIKSSILNNRLSKFHLL